MKRYGLIVIALLAGAFFVGDHSKAADGERQAQGAEQAVNDFWGRWENAKPSEAIRRSGPTADYPRIWDELAEKSDDFQNRAGGRCLGHSEIVHKQMGENVAYFAFYALYEPTPLRVQMLLYRAKENWSVIDLKIDSEPMRWLDEMEQSVMPTPPGAAQGN